MEEGYEERRLLEWMRRGYEVCEFCQKKIGQRFEVRICVGLPLVMVEYGFFVGVCLLCSSVFCD